MNEFERYRSNVGDLVAQINQWRTKAKINEAHLQEARRIIYELEQRIADLERKLNDRREK